MPSVAEKPISTSTDDMPEFVKEFVHKRISNMSEKELRAWKKESKKIIRKAKRAASTSSGVAAPDVQRAAGRTQ